MVGNTPAASADKTYTILAHFLMVWDNPNSIVAYLIPLINRGLKYGKQANRKTVRGWDGYYIEAEDVFLEGIDGDVIGGAFVTEKETILSPDKFEFDELKLPSADFKEIVLQWLLFILRNKEMLNAK